MSVSCAGFDPSGLGLLNRAPTRGLHICFPTFDAAFSFRGEHFGGVRCAGFSGGSADESRRKRHLFVNVRPEASDVPAVSQTPSKGRARTCTRRNLGGAWLLAIIFSRVISRMSFSAHYSHVEDVGKWAAL